MSLVYGKPYTVEKVIDPISDFSVNQKRNFLYVEAAKNKFYKTQPATTNSNSQTVWSNIAPPSVQSLQSRIVPLKTRVRVTAVGTNSTVGANLFQSGSVAFRANPLANSMHTLQYSINGYPISRNISKYINTLLRFSNTTAQRELFESTTASMLDNCQDYSQVNLTNMNPLSSFNDSTILTSGRGSISYDSLINTPTGFTLEATLEELLHITPLTDKDFDLQQGLFNIRDTALIIIWESNLPARMLSINPNAGLTFTSLTVEVLDYPELLFLYCSPSLLNPIPKNLVYPATNHVYNVQNVGITLAPGATYTLTSQNQQWGTIPDLVLHWCEVLDADKSPYLPDAYSKINKVSINWNTQSGVLSSCDVTQLWRISVESGLRMNFQDWSAKNRYLSVGNSTSTMAGAGSILCFSPEILGVLEEGQASGMLYNVQYNITMEIQNNSPTPKNYQLCTLTVYNGVLTVDETQMVNESYGIIAPIDVINAPVSNVKYNQAKHMAELSGGGAFWDGFKSVMGNVLKYAPIVGDVARTIGKLTGNGLSGGAFANRGDLMQHLKNYK
jgi:hypothetical protein